MLYLTLLWHQHQPLYKDLAHPTAAGSYRQPWVRLHAISHYYGMAALVAAHPGIRLTINLSPVLLWQLEDLVDRGATDRARELTTKAAEELTDAEAEELLASFFDAHWHNQIFPYPRYKELFAQRQDGRPFSGQDLRDLQMWFNLTWFAPEFRDGEVLLATGETASVRRFAEQGRHFTTSDVQAMLAEQDKVLRAVIPLHRQLQDRGQIEVSTTPFAHPILPLLIDSDQATIDRPEASYPPRFRRPDDAETHMRRAVEWFERHFGRPPTGMWPAEGAVSQAVIPCFARHGVRWIATDQGVLARSGRWGYDVANPEVLCQPYRAEEGDASVSIFFRETGLSDAIGFRYYAYDDPERAARDFLTEVKERFARRLSGDADWVLTIVLDGENAWGAYREDARPFLHALYGLLEEDDDVRAVTFGEYLDGNPGRGVAAHPVADQTKVYDLFTGSWIDESGSASGVDLGTWIGEPEENRAWELLGQARDALDQRGATRATAPAAFEALAFAEGSDWFWWFGEDQDAGRDDAFDDLFRGHLASVYREAGSAPPSTLEAHIVHRAAVWSFAQQVSRIQAGDRLRVRTNCPGVLTWWVDADATQESALAAVGGVMAGVRRYQALLGPFPPGAQAVRFRFRCTYPGCLGDDICCSRTDHVVQIGPPVSS